MQVRARNSASAANQPENFSCLQRLAVAHTYLAQVAMHGHESLAMIYDHRVAVEEEISARRDDAVCRCLIGVPSAAAISIPLCGERGCSL